MQQELGNRLRIVLVEAGEDPDEVRAFLAANPPPASATIASDISGETRRRWHVDALPWFFLVRPERGGGANGQRMGERLGAGARQSGAPAAGRRAARPAARGPRPAKAAPAPASPPEREGVKGVEVLRGPG